MSINNIEYNTIYNLLSIEPTDSNLNKKQYTEDFFSKYLPYRKVSRITDKSERERKYINDTLITNNNMVFNINDNKILPFFIVKSKSSESYNTINTIIVVAHPDDEILWAHDILFNKNNNIMVICLSNAYHYIRRYEFIKSMIICNVKHYIMFPFIDCFNKGVNNLCFDNEQSKTLLIKLFNDISEANTTNKEITVFTHNEKGEYGHNEHIQTNIIVSNVVKTFNNNQSKITLNLTLFHFNEYLNFAEYNDSFCEECDNNLSLLKLLNKEIDTNYIFCNKCKESSFLSLYKIKEQIDKYEKNISDIYQKNNLYPSDCFLYIIDKHVTILKSIEDNNIQCIQSIIDIINSKPLLFNNSFVLRDFIINCIYRSQNTIEHIEMSDSVLNQQIKLTF